MKNIRNKATSDNSGHTATVLRTYAQIRQSRTSYVRRTLGVIVVKGIRGVKNMQETTIQPNNRLRNRIKRKITEVR